VLHAIRTITVMCCNARIAIDTHMVHAGRDVIMWCMPPHWIHQCCMQCAQYANAARRSCIQLLAFACSRQHTYSYHHMLHDVLQPCSIAAMPVYMVTVCIAMACGASTWYVILICCVCNSYLCLNVSRQYIILLQCTARSGIFTWWMQYAMQLCGAYGACGVSVCNWILLYHRWCFVCIGKSWQLTTTVATHPLASEHQSSAP
jgi:hypothetical protein